jgi:hypothetical protein
MPTLCNVAIYFYTREFEKCMKFDFIPMLSTRYIKHFHSKIKFALKLLVQPPTVKRSEREADHSPSSVRVRSEWCTSTPPTQLHGAVLNYEPRKLYLLNLILNCAEMRTETRGRTDGKARSFYDLCAKKKRMKSIFLTFQSGLNPRFIHFLFSHASAIRFIKSRVEAHGRYKGHIRIFQTAN